MTTPMFDLSRLKRKEPKPLTKPPHRFPGWKHQHSTTMSWALSNTVGLKPMNRRDTAYLRRENGFDLRICYEPVVESWVLVIGYLSCTGFGFDMISSLREMLRDPSTISVLTDPEIADVTAHAFEFYESNSFDAPNYLNLGVRGNRSDKFTDGWDRCDVTWDELYDAAERRMLGWIGELSKMPLSWWLSDRSYRNIADSVMGRVDSLAGMQNTDTLMQRITNVYRKPEDEVR